MAVGVPAKYGFPKHLSPTEPGFGHPLPFSQDCASPGRGDVHGRGVDIRTARWQRLAVLPHISLLFGQCANGWWPIQCPILSFHKSFHHSFPRENLTWILKNKQTVECFLLISFCHPNFQVTIVKWWMAHYGAKTAKRHYLFSNSPAVGKLDKGRLVGWKKVAKDKQTAVHYRDSSGQLRYKGTGQLKATQILGLDCSFYFSELMGYIKTWDLHKSFF